MRCLTMAVTVSASGWAPRDLFIYIFVSLNNVGEASDRGVVRSEGGEEEEAVLLSSLAAAAAVVAVAQVLHIPGVLSALYAAAAAATTNNTRRAHSLALTARM